MQIIIILPSDYMSIVFQLASFVEVNILYPFECMHQAYSIQNGIIHNLAFRMESYTTLCFLSRKTYFRSNSNLSWFAIGWIEYIIGQSERAPDCYTAIG